MHVTGGAFSGLRPTSFTRGRAPARSRVSSITEEEQQSGEQPLVSQSYSGGFGRSESSLGGGSVAGDRPIASRRIAGSKSSDREGGRGRGSRADREGGRRVRKSRSRSHSRGSKGAASSTTSSTAGGSSSASAPAPAAAAAGDGMDSSGKSRGSRGGGGGGGRGASSSANGYGYGAAAEEDSPPQDRAHAMYRNQHGSIGTALHAVDRVQTISASKSQKPGAAAAVAAGKVASNLPKAQRRSSHSGPVGTTRKVSPTPNGASPVASGGGTMLPRRTSTGQLNAAASTGSNFDSVTTIGTPGMPQESSSMSMSRALSRAAGSRNGRTR